MRILTEKNGRIIIRGNTFEYDRVVDMMKLELLRDKKLTIEEGVSNHWMGGYQGILRPKTKDEVDEEFERYIWLTYMSESRYKTAAEITKSIKEHRLRYYGDEVWKLFDETTIEQLKYPRAYIK